MPFSGQRRAERARCHDPAVAAQKLGADLDFCRKVGPDLKLSQIEHELEVACYPFHWSADAGKSSRVFQSAQQFQLDELGQRIAPLGIRQAGIGAVCRNHVDAFAVQGRNRDRIGNDALGEGRHGRAMERPGAMRS